MSTTRALPAAWACLEAALRQRHPVHVAYHDRSRTVCPHALGWHNHRPMLLGYQIGGDTSTGTLDPDPRKRWRCMYIDQIDHVTADTTIAWQSADNYNPSRPFPAVDNLSVAV